MSDSTIRIRFLGDSASAVRSVRTLESGFGGLGRAATLAGAAITAGVVTGLAAAVKAAVDFDKEMRNVNSIAKLSEKQFKALSKEVLALGKVTGQGPSTLAKGMYDIVSSGFKAADALKILKVSAIAATAGMTNTATASKAVVAVLNAYQLGADKAKNVSSLLFKEVQLGVNTFEELAANIGDTAPLAAALHIPFSDVAAGLALITKHGTSMAEASTQMSRVMADLLKPSKELSATLKSMGYESGQAAIQAHGFIPLINELSTAAGGSADKTSEWFHNIRSLRGILNLTGGNIKEFNQFAKDMSASFRKGGDDVKAFNEQSKSISVQWAKAKAAITAAAIPIGQLLFPALTRATEGVSSFAEAIDRNMPKIKQDFSDVANVVQTLGSTAKNVAATSLGQSGLLGALAAFGTIRVAEKVRDIRAALVGLGSTMNLVALGVGALAAAWLYSSQQAQEFKRRIEDLRNALVGESDAHRNLKQAQLGVEQSEVTLKMATLASKNAHEEAATAIRKYGKDSDQARQAILNAQAAENAKRQAVLDHTNAMKDESRAEQTVADATVRAKAAVTAAYAKAAHAIEVFGSKAGVTQGVLYALGKALHDAAKDAGTAVGPTLLYAQAVEALNTQLGRLPSRKEVTIYLTTIQRYQSYGTGRTTPTGVTSRAGGGFIPHVSGSVSGTDSVPAMLTPGEIVLNRSQQNALGGPKYLSQLFGFTGERGPGFAEGGLVAPTGVKRGKTPGYRALRRRKKYGGAARSALSAVEEVNQREENLDRAYGQLVREYGISHEEFIVTDADGNETLDREAIAKHLGEIDSLAGSRQQMLALIEEEKRKLNAAISALQKAIENLLREIKAEQAAAKEDAERAREMAKRLSTTNKQKAQVERDIDLERRKSFPAGKAGAAARKASQERIYAMEDQRDSLGRQASDLETGIKRHGKSRAGHFDRIQNLQGIVKDFRGALGDARDNLRNNVGFDKRDVQLDILELKGERSDIEAIRPRPNAPPIGSDGGGGGLTAAAAAGPSDDVTEALRAEIARLTEETGHLRLGLAVQGRQNQIIGSFQKGTLHVPETGLALVHAGERITPAGSRDMGGGDSPVYVNVTLEPDMAGLERFVTVKAVKATRAISERIGTAADRRARVGRA